MTGARTLLRNGLAQNDVDMNHFRLLNLDTSNLPPVGIPPTVNPPPSNWLRSWDAPSQSWGFSQPSFADISGDLTATQQLRIVALGNVRAGSWQADPISGAYLPTLDGIRSAVGDVSLGGHKLTNVANPINPGDAVNKGFMDLLLLGLNPKEAVRCATTGEVTIATLSRPVDGVTLIAGDRVLVKNQSSERFYENGIYAAATGVWQRVDDADSAAELARAYCSVLEGTVNAGTGWVQINTLTDPIGIGDDVEFVIFSGASALLPGLGLQLAGNTLNVVGTPNRIVVGSGVDIASNYAGQNSITTLGTVTQGQWHATVIPPLYGGTGMPNQYTITLAGTFTLAAGLGSGPEAIPANLTLRVLGASDVNVPASGTLATVEGTEVLRNKEIEKRTVQTSTAVTPAINVDATDNYQIVGLAGPITSMTSGLTGTPSAGQELTFWILDDGIAHGIAWGTAYTASPSLPLPVNTIASKWLYVKFIYNDLIAKWVLIDKLENI